MKRFLVQFGVISILILIICFGLSQVTFSDDFISYKTKDTAYKKIGWNLHLINEEPERINNSVIFLGSSLVQVAINDSLMQANGINAINMGVPHNGNELWLYFLDRLKDKNPKKVIFLKGKTPFQGLHKLTPLLFTSSKLIANGQSINKDYIEFVFKKSKLTLEYLFFNFFGDNTSNLEYDKFLKNPYGVVFVKDTISRGYYDEVVQVKTIKDSDEYYNLYKNDFRYQKEVGNDNFMTNFRVLKRRLVIDYWVGNNYISNIWSQERFADEMIQIGLNNGIDIQKIYIPKLVDVNHYSGYERSDYKAVPSDSVGILSLDDHGFLKEHALWGDFDHLDEEGANLYTQKLIEIFGKELKD